MPVTIHTPKSGGYSRREILRSYEDPGRRVGKPVGSHMTELISLGKAISLCPLCVGKFNPRAHRYEHFTSPEIGVFSIANCDACRTHDPRCKTFIPQSLHDDVNNDAYRRGRWAQHGGPRRAMRKSR